jgi:hypothetical protein
MKYLVLWACRRQPNKTTWTQTSVSNDFQQRKCTWALMQPYSPILQFERQRQLVCQTVSHRESFYTSDPVTRRRTCHPSIHSLYWHCNTSALQHRSIHRFDVHVRRVVSNYTVESCTFAGIVLFDEWWNEYLLDSLESASNSIKLYRWLGPV